MDASAVAQATMLHFAGQKYEDLLRRLKRRKTLFEDPEFVCSASLLPDTTDTTKVEWLRPAEICKRLKLKTGPEMFVSDVDRFDIRQGDLGNCWFLAALANLAEDKDGRFLRVVPEGQGFNEECYAGIFRFRFWRMGKWLEVVVDDRLPCTKRGRLFFLKSAQQEEFWGALLEKAYAKLHGSYTALIGGHTLEAAVDFTGGIPETIEVGTFFNLDTLFKVMAAEAEKGAFMGASLSNSNLKKAQKKGLVGEHSYTITKVAEAGNNIKLVRLRNPYGNEEEWTGEWCDGHPIWDTLSQETKTSLNLTFQHDGEFYMSFSEFVLYYGELEICHLSLESADEDGGNFSMTTFEFSSQFAGKWVRGESDGGCGNEGYGPYSSNPQFFFELSDPDPEDEEDKCPVVAALSQAAPERKSLLAVGFRIYKCEKEEKLDEKFFRKNSPVADRPHAFVRDSSHRCRLLPGRYCIVPSTFDRGQEAEFLLRIFVQNHWAKK